MKRWVGLAVTAFAAICATGYGWYRTLSFDRPTTPRHIVWSYADGSLVDAAHGDTVGRPGVYEALVLGTRLIVRAADSSSEHPSRQVGYGYIEPSSNRGKIAWPIAADAQERYSTVALAVRDEHTFAVAFEVFPTDAPYGPRPLYVGIAGPEGWLRAPTEIEDAPGMAVRAMSWVDGAVELVLLHPGASHIDGMAVPDVSGRYSQPDVIRVPLTGELATRSLAFTCEHCEVVEVIRRDNDWRVVLRTWDGNRLTDDTVVASATTQVPGPPAVPLERGLSPDRTSLGVVSSTLPTNRVTADGTVVTTPPLVPGWENVWMNNVVGVRDGALTRLRFSFDQTGHSAGEALETTTGIVYIGHQHDYDLAGTSLTTMHPVVDAAFLSDMVMLPRTGGGYYATTGMGTYVALDANLRRTDSLSVREHLRNQTPRASYDDFLGWVLFGLPLVALVGIALGFVRDYPRPGRWGSRTLSFMLGVNTLVSVGLLLKVLPLL
ncbi:MAG TPA: hypothetical protein VGM90_01240 [Kofleriaceae bacterium]|jgi:hypothetical protein